MREQMLSLKRAAYAKLGLPAPEEEPSAAHAESGSEPPATAEVDDEVIVIDENRTPNAAYKPGAEASLNARLAQALRQPPLPKPLADALREPLQKLDVAATKRLDEAKDAIERGREGLARGLSDALARMRPVLEEATGRERRND